MRQQSTTYAPEFLTKFWRKSSSIVITSLFLMVSNPAPHALIIAETPCAPQFVSSLILPCINPATRLPYLYGLPFFLFENYVVSLILYELCFAWSVLYLGFSWVLSQLLVIGSLPDQKKSEMQARYIAATRMAEAVNDGMKLYMSYFASIMFTILALLIFGCVRLLHLDFRANVMFPCCGLRCGFESMSPIAVAGRVDEQSKQLQARWRKVSKTATERRAWTWRVIKMRAGDLYTFERGIVLVSLNNLIGLVLDWLVAF